MRLRLHLVILGGLLAVLSLCAALSRPAVAQTRLGLHVTQEELNIWRQRMTDNVNTINGFTYQSIYQNRIVVDANLFRSQSHPGGDGFWAGWTGAGCAAQCSDGTNSCATSGRLRPQGTRFERGVGSDLLRAAYTFLLTGDVSYATPVRSELLNQIAQSGTNWANTSKWCINTGGFPLAFEIVPWIVRLLLAYDYLQAGGYTGFSALEKTNIDTWFHDAATFWHVAQETLTGYSDYTGVYQEPQNLTCAGSKCTDLSQLLYQGGPTARVATYNFFMGQMTSIPVLEMAVGVKLSNMTHITNAKKWVTAFVKVGIWNNGAIADFGRWSDCVPGCPGSMWGHTGAPIAALTLTMDMLARTGDTSLYDLSAPTQVLGGAAGTVNFLMTLDLIAKMANKTVQLYGSSVQPSQLLTWDVDAGCCGNYYDFSSMAANLYYQDSDITTAVTRNALASNTNISNGTLSGGCFDAQYAGCWSGVLGQWPDLPFMYGNMHGQLNPYGETAPGVTVDSTFAGFSAAPVNDSVINASGGIATTWRSPDTAADHYVIINFGAPQDVRTAALYWAYDAAQQKYMTSNTVAVQSWNGSTYQTVATMNYAGDVPSTQVNFPVVNTSRIRFYQGANQGNPTYPGVLWITEADYAATSTLPPRRLMIQRGP